MSWKGRAELRDSIEQVLKAAYMALLLAHTPDLLNQFYSQASRSPLHSRLFRSTYSNLKSRANPLTRELLKDMMSALASSPYYQLIKTRRSRPGERQRCIEQLYISIAAKMSAGTPSSPSTAGPPEQQSRTLKLAQHEESDSSSEDDDDTTSKQAPVTPTKSTSIPVPSLNSESTKTNDASGVTSPSSTQPPAADTPSLPPPPAAVAEQPGNDAVTALHSMFPGMDMTSA